MPSDVQVVHTKAFLLSLRDKRLNCLMTSILMTCRPFYSNFISRAHGRIKLSKILWSLFSETAFGVVDLQKNDFAFGLPIKYLRKISLLENKLSRSVRRATATTTCAFIVFVSKLHSHLRFKPNLRLVSALDVDDQSIVVAGSELLFERCWRCCLCCSWSLHTLENRLRMSCINLGWVLAGW